MRCAEACRMRVSVDGAPFEVRDEGEGQALALLHGFPLDHKIWDAQAAALAGRARVIRYDLRGLGESPATPGPYLMERLAGDLVEILDALGVERAVVVGHSLGGYVALAFFRMFAERCAGLGLVCSRTSADTPEAAAARLALADRVERDGIGPVVETFVPKLLAPDAYAAHPQLVAQITATVERTDPRGAAAMLRGMAARVASDDLYDEMRLPVGIVAGARDALIPPDAARALAAAVVNATLDVLDCGHLPSCEVPDALGVALGRLLDRVSGAAPLRAT